MCFHAIQFQNTAKPLSGVKHIAWITRGVIYVNTNGAQSWMKRRYVPNQTIGDNTPQNRGVAAPPPV